jgi:hypothetical protein
MFEPDPCAVARMEGIGHVPCREDAGDARLEPLVDEDTVVDAEAGRIGQFGPRADPDTDNHGIGAERRPVGEPDPFHRRGADELLNAHAEVQVHAVVGMEAPVDLAHFHPEHPFERHRDQLHHRHVGAELACGGRHLGPDPPGTDHDDPCPAGEQLAERVLVGHRAQVPDAVEVCTGHGQVPRGGTGGEQKPTVADALPAGEGDRRGAGGRWP